MGFRLTNLLRSSWIVAVALAAAAITILVARHFGTLKETGTPTDILKRYCGYAIWSGVQQILLQDFFLDRFGHLIPNPRNAAFAAAGIFALAHLPNPILTLATLLWGTIACLLFLRYRNLYPLAVAHAIMGISLAITIPGPIIRNMRVGLGYLEYPGHSFHHHQPNPAAPTAETLPTPYRPAHAWSLTHPPAAPRATPARKRSQPAPPSPRSAS